MMDTRGACGHSARMCKSVKKCVPLSKVCDGRDDCEDRSDESGCRGRREVNKRVFGLNDKISNLLKKLADTACDEKDNVFSRRLEEELMTRRSVDSQDNTEAMKRGIKKLAKSLADAACAQKDDFFKQMADDADIDGEAPVAKRFDFAGLISHVGTIAHAIGGAIGAEDSTSTDKMQEKRSNSIQEEKRQLEEKRFGEPGNGEGPVANTKKLEKRMNRIDEEKRALPDPTIRFGEGESKQAPVDKRFDFGGLIGHIANIGKAVAGAIQGGDDDITKRWGGGWGHGASAELTKRGGASGADGNEDDISKRWGGGLGHAELSKRGGASGADKNEDENVAQDDLAKRLMVEGAVAKRFLRQLEKKNDVAKRPLHRPIGHAQNFQ